MYLRFAWMCARRKEISMKFDVFIQAGQSNAEGSGIGDVRSPYEPEKRICFLEAEKTVITTDTGLDIQYADKPFVIQPADYHGADRSVGDFSLSFSKAYIAAGLLVEDRGVLIVRAGVGGTGFQKHHWGIDEILYNKMIAMVDYALSLNSENRLMGLLWHQGEHDAFEGNTRECYHEQLTALIESVRMRYHCPELPFVCAGFTQDWTEKNKSICEPILSALRQTAKEQNGTFVETDGLLSNDQMTGNGDDIHFCRQALHTLGLRYLDAYMCLTKAVD